MISQASVILATGGGMRGEGMRMVEGEGACVAGETATAADGRHSTGMHSIVKL